MLASVKLGHQNPLFPLAVLFKVLEIQLQYTYSTWSSFLLPNGQPTDNR